MDFVRRLVNGIPLSAHRNRSCETITPADGDPLHPHSDERYRASYRIEAEVCVPQR
jgi:hypothetical protein